MIDDLSTTIENQMDPSHGIFYVILVGSLLATIVLVVLQFIVGFATGRRTTPRLPWTMWERLVYLGTLASVAVLGITAFVAVIRFGVLDGWWLFVHMFGAGALVAVLPILALTWFIPNLFSAEEADSRRTSTLRSWIADSDTEYAPRFFWLPKALFWIVIAGGLVVSMTMLLSMLPLFGTDGLELLLEIHRYAGLAVVIALVLHLSSVILQRMGLA